MSAILDAALQLAAAGVPVCPTIPDHTKRPRPGLGSHHASTDPADIRSWWRRWPDSNLAIACGVVWDVLDVDVKHGQPGLRNLRRIATAGLLDGHGPVVRTPSGGWHIYMAATSDPPGAITGTGIEFKGHRVLVTTPPSAIDGRPYRFDPATWGVPGTPGHVAQLDWTAVKTLIGPPPAPPRPPREPGGSLDGLEQMIRELTEGNRNNGTWWAMARAAEDGHDPADLADAALSIGLGRLEVTAIVRSARRKRKEPTR